MTRLPLTFIEPGSPPRFPPVSRALRDPDGLLAVGGDLRPERLLAAYRHGIFPWFSESDPILWWSPDPRCVFRTERLRPNRSLRRQVRGKGWRITVNQAFDRVIEACAAPRPGQDGTWIGPAMIQAYSVLHRLGHAHSMEVWDDDALVGGVYGVAVGRLFCGESMFSAQSGGSKMALCALAALLREGGAPLLDAQVSNPHLLSLGAEEWPRKDFVARAEALASQPLTADIWRPTPPRLADDLLRTAKSNP
ncbi:leucyl/phenylalanyl-tRNA--protein transferase [Oleiagrimonas citrea]|uniref:Leucyl/phenylalanyl-tRNA--protein transferase n=1 Tax=Oleiagrimonas citrea TaxID=1665687 RepID=A0A846ZP20_9GAMM|nr:leucyl/phenylalanyl-tRNA--protein transferase [Oleiagrimonas citrea]NKZ39191.1 leucyl/phenylalanyl-tRNA--protein transferase [Oleiagrimonas citrea]